MSGPMGRKTDEQNDEVASRTETTLPFNISRDLDDRTGHDVVDEEETVVYAYQDAAPHEGRCGFGCFKPAFLQPLNNIKVFLLVFVFAGISQGMFYTIWNMTLSSIEKRFQIPSKTTGIITAINDFSHIAVVFFVAHFCGRGHRPRWLAAGLLTVGIAALIFAAPELFAPKWDSESIGVRTNSTVTFDKEMCLTDNQADMLKAQCKLEAPSHVNNNIWTFVLLGTAQILLGIGSTAPIVLAMPFIDDNVKTKNSPIYFSLGFTGRFIGPLFGVFLGSFCLSTYVDLTVSPNIAQTDPRWMGAWYLGFLVVGVLMCLNSTFYLFFPAKVPATQRVKPGAGASIALEPSVRKANGNGIRSSAKKKTLSQQFAAIPGDLKRLLVNKVFVCRVANDCIDMLVVSGYFSFAPKYMEYYFRMSPAQAGRANGLASICAVAGGATVGGLIIKKLNLQPKHVAIMIIISSIAFALCYFFLMMITCDPRTLYAQLDADNMLVVDSACSNGCNCAGRPFSPVCDEATGLNYYSPCHAGCSSVSSEKTGKYYGNCTCLAQSGWKFPDALDDPLASSVPFAQADNLVTARSGEFKTDKVLRRGFCETDGCSSFWVYMAVSTGFKFIGALPMSGGQMITFRIVDPDLKSLAKALETLLTSLFAFIPGPIIMGMLVDSACRLWNTQVCSGGKGACLVYDLDSLRIKMHLYVAVVKIIACVMDVYVYYKIRHIKFERDPEAASQPIVFQSIPTGSVHHLATYD